MGRRSSSVRSAAALLLLCLLLAGCGGDRERPSELLVFGVAPDYDEIAEEIVAVSPDGGELRRLTRGVPGYAYSPVVSPDGRYIAFSVSESLTPPESSAWVMAHDGTKRRRLALKRDGYSYAEGWSPDGKSLLYSLVGFRRDGELVDRGLWTVAVDGGDKRRLVAKGAWGDAAWSPDGSAIAFMTGEETFSPVVHLYDVPERQSRVLVRGAFLPRWTPDGKRLLFKRIFRGKRSGFYVVDRDGGTPRLLERIGAEDDPWLGDVSPDGKWVLVGYHPAISKISLDDGEVQRLTNGESDWAPTWSPDGERIAFERDGDIWVMDADGGDARVVARAPRARVYTRPHWLTQER